MSRNRDFFHSCEHVAQRYRLGNWLSETNNEPVVSRVSYRTPGAKTLVSYSDRVGEKYAREVIHLGSYNYSGLNGHPRIIEAFVRAATTYGSTTSGVRLLNGTTDLHVEFEQRLARFLGVEGVITYSSGFASNLSVLQTVISPDDLVFTDALNHQSIQDGLALSKAEIVRFRHSCMESLEHALRLYPVERRKFIVVDGVFSMDGDIAPLPDIVALANRYNCFVVVDDAHATAALGPHGRGTAAHFGLTGEVDIITGSLSKGLPGVGGFAAGSRRLIDLLRYGSHGYIFSASLPAPTVAGLIAALDLLEEAPEIQSRLHRNADLLRDGIRSLGCDTMRSTSAIIPVLMRDGEYTFEVTRQLHEQGIYVNPVIWPAVSHNLSRLRLNATAALTESDITYAVERLGSILVSAHEAIRKCS